MKHIKQIILFAILVGTIGAYAQEDTPEDLFIVPLSDSGSPGKLIVGLVTGSITVTGYEGKEVAVGAIFDGDRNNYIDNKEKKGLKRIDGTSTAVAAEEKNNVVRVTSKNVNKQIHLVIKVPQNFDLKLSTVNGGDIKAKGVNGEFEISNVNGGIALTDVSGSASVDTVNGDVIVDFKSVTKDAPMAFSSLNGDLEIAFPSTLKANVKFKSDMGDIYSDFDMEMDKRKAKVETNNSSNTYKVKIEQWLYGKINGGGPEMLFKTFNGDILIKSK